VEKSYLPMLGIRCVYRMVNAKRALSLEWYSAEQTLKKAAEPSHLLTSYSITLWIFNRDGDMQELPFQTAQSRNVVKYLAFYNFCCLHTNSYPPMSFDVDQTMFLRLTNL
jgi:hypothetical protein